MMMDRTDIMMTCHVIITSVLFLFFDPVEPFLLVVTMFMVLSITIIAAIEKNEKLMNDYIKLENDAQLILCSDIKTNLFPSNSEI